MKELKNYKGVIAFLLIMTVLNLIPFENYRPTEYVKGNDEIIDSEVASNI